MSSASESDDDYVPEEPGRVSEEESADDETNLQYEKELEHKTKKRKSDQLCNGKKKIKLRNSIKEIENKEEEVKSDTQNTEEEKKREDDLWAKFLEGTDTKPRSTDKEPGDMKPTKSSKVVEPKKGTDVVNEKEDSKERERRIFEFAGETIVVENNVIKEKINTPETTTMVHKLEGTSRNRGSGLSSVLGHLNKKNTLSTLEKSKLDWDTYKKEEGVEEEIVNHNKGKAGFLDRRDFLERTDVRQYEIERDLRMSRRSKR